MATFQFFLSSNQAKSTEYPAYSKLLIEDLEGSFASLASTFLAILSNYGILKSLEFKLVVRQMGDFSNGLAFAKALSSLQSVLI